MARRTQKTERFARYDSADYLKTPENVAEYLVAAFEAGVTTPRIWLTSSVSPQAARRCCEPAASCARLSS